MSRVLVTGGCGFVGVSVVARLLDQGHDVTVVDNLSRGTERALKRRVGDIELAKGDVRDPSLLDKIFARASFDAVVHLAAMHFIPDCDRDPESCLSNNTQATQALADSAIASGTVSSFIFASTAAVYAPSAKAHAESSPLAPTDVYGFSKLAAEQLLHLVGLGRRMTVGIARLFNVYGPGETNPHLIPVVIQQAMRSSRLSLGNLNTRRDYVYTEDVASGIAAILARAQSGAGGIFNLGGGRPRSGREVVSAIAAALSRELVVLEDPDKVRANDRPRLTADVSLAREVLNWAPSWDFDEAMRVVVSDPTQ